MDHFGIGVGISGAVRVYLQSGRHTGRTTSLVESVKDGDRVVFINEREARRVQALCKERGVAIEIVVNDPKDVPRLFDRPTSSGNSRTVFDHSWVEQFYLNSIERAAQEVDHLQTQLSGSGPAHAETRRRAEEIARWGY